VQTHIPSQLVKIGMVPESLAKVIVAPPNMKQGNERKYMFDKARIII
jgi:hypothetical protein